MGHPGRLSVGLAATATIILLVLLGVAAYTLPARFDDDGQTAPPAPASAQVAPALQKAAAPVEKPAAAPAVGSLISATFSQLPQAQPASAVAVASAAAAAAPVAAPSGEAPSGTAPAMHVVKTTTIRVDPEPATAQAQPLAMANDTAAPVAVASVAAPEASAAPGATPVPMAPAPKAAPAKAAKPVAAHSGDQMKVGGAGVTVRAGPSKAKSQLFNLAAGQKVMVGARQRGWVQVTDSQGRAGWVYSELLRKL